MSQQATSVVGDVVGAGSKPKSTAAALSSVHSSSVVWPCVLVGGCRKMQQSVAGLGPRNMKPRPTTPSTRVPESFWN